MCTFFKTPGHTDIGQMRQFVESYVNLPENKEIKTLVHLKTSIQHKQIYEYEIN